MPVVILVIMTSSMLSLPESWSDDSSEVEVEVVGCMFVFYFFPLHDPHNYVVFALFGIRFSPKQTKWKKLPFLQAALWHFTSLSASIAFNLQMQILLQSIASLLTVDGVTVFLLVAYLPCLNCGNLQQWGQYHCFGMETSLSAKHVVWD